MAITLVLTIEQSRVDVTTSMVILALHRNAQDTLGTLQPALLPVDSPQVSLYSNET